MKKHFLTITDNTPLYIEPLSGVVSSDVREYNGVAVVYWALNIKEGKDPEQWKQVKREATIPAADDLRTGYLRFPPRSER